MGVDEANFSAYSFLSLSLKGSLDLRVAYRTPAAIPKLRTIIFYKYKTNHPEFKPYYVYFRGQSDLAEWLFSEEQISELSIWLRLTHR